MTRNVMFLVLASAMTISINCAAEEQNETVQRVEEKDPFGDSDPFAIIDTPSESTALSQLSEATTASQADLQAQVDFRYNLIDANNASRIMSRDAPALKTSVAMLQSRMLVSDSLSDRHEWRWLFRGFAETSNEREANDNLNSRFRIDEIFTDWKNQGNFASLGKRRINWGHAQAFNPVNMVAPRRDPLDPTVETEGRPMLWLSRTSGRASAEFVLTRDYDTNWQSDKNQWGLKYGFPIAESDFAFYYFDGGDYADGRAYERMFGASFSANVVPGLTLYMEAANFLKDYRNYYDANGVAQYKDRSYFQGVIGSSIDLGEKSSVFIEYYLNGQGYSEAERKTYLRNVDVQLAGGDDAEITDDFIGLAMNKNYLLMNYRKEYREKFLFNVSMLAAADGSYSARLRADYAISDYYDIWASYLNNDGNRDTEFGNNPLTGLFEIALRVSF